MQERGCRPELRGGYSKYTEWEQCFPGLVRLSRGSCFVDKCVEWQRVGHGKECD